MRRGISVLAVAALVLIGGAVGAQAQQCDFLTGGGFIILDSGAKGTFGVAGSCNLGGDGHGLWGHLEYHDHGTGLNVHWTTITDYTLDPAEPKARFICGTARSNQNSGEVDWVVRAKDADEPGVNDEFWVQVSQSGLATYTSTPDMNHKLGGGNIQLHPQTRSGVLRPAPDLINCPAFFAVPCPNGPPCLPD